MRRSREPRAVRRDSGDGTGVCAVIETRLTQLSRLVVSTLSADRHKLIGLNDVSREVVTVNTSRIEPDRFLPTTWLGRGGFFHSSDMRVVEKFTRQGDVILYDVTVEDPQVLVEPWVIPTRVLRKNTNRDAGLQRERGNCEVYELEDISSQIRH